MYVSILAGRGYLAELEHGEEATIVCTFRGEPDTQAVRFRAVFSDPSSFHRAFRRWTGVTPMQYRESAR